MRAAPRPAARVSGIHVTVSRSQSPCIATGWTCPAEGTDDRQDTAVDGFHEGRAGTVRVQRLGRGAPQRRHGRVASGRQLAGRRQAVRRDRHRRRLVRPDLRPAPVRGRQDAQPSRVGSRSRAAVAARACAEHADDRARRAHCRDGGPGAARRGMGAAVAFERPVSGVGIHARRPLGVLRRMGSRAA